jgi:hypothetical protein
VRYCPQHVVQRKLGVSGRTLGRITGNIWVNDGDSKLDLGLAVKAHGKGLCVPGYTQLNVSGRGRRRRWRAGAGCTGSCGWRWGLVLAAGLRAAGLRGPG